MFHLELLSSQIVKRFENIFNDINNEILELLKFSTDFFSGHLK